MGPTRLSLSSPCCLHLGCARTSDGALSELGVALQHPPIQLEAWPAASLSVSGPRADLAAAQAAALGLAGRIEIELAIPANMGLSSDGMLGTAMKRLASAWGARRHSFRMSLPEAAAHRGGLLQVDDEGLVRERADIAQAGEADDWVFVLALPREPDDLVESYETAQRERLIAAAPHLRADAATLFDAARRRDLDAFAAALAAIHAANAAALAAGGWGVAPGDHDGDILDTMRAHGALACARSLTGLGVYGLIQGGAASRTLRKALVARVGYFGPLVMASICDNQGARIEGAP